MVSVPRGGGDVLPGQARRRHAKLAGTLTVIIVAVTRGRTSPNLNARQKRNCDSGIMV